MNALVTAGDGVRNNTVANYYLVSEEILAAYAMATTDFDWGNIVYGVRAEQVKNTGQAYVNFPAVGTTPAATRLVTSGSDDVQFYPSAHLNWNITDSVKARFGLTTSASRPDFDDLRPNFTISDSTQSISGGNPDAKPEKQVGLDAYVEWYMSRSGFMSAGVFYKKISDVLVKRSSLFGQTELNLPGLDRSSYAYTAIGNGGDGNLQGLELAYVGTIEQFAQDNNWPEWTEGFGANLSATFTSSEVNLPAISGVPARTISLLGSSDGVYNVQATYEKYGLSVRLAYQYRTPWGEAIGDYRVINGGVYPVDNGDIFWDADEELDLSIRYQVNDQMEVYLDGVNLTNQGSRRYGDQSRYPIEYEKFGKRYIGGVRFKF
jgi:TonB-dependent receptor